MVIRPYVVVGYVSTSLVVVIIIVVVVVVPILQHGPLVVRQGMHARWT